MFHELANHNDDIRRLVEKGYAVAFDSGHVVVRDIPYLDASGGLQHGALVVKLVHKSRFEVVQNDHQVYFAGGAPHETNGTIVKNLGGGPSLITLSDSCSDIKVQRSFSNKPYGSGAFVDLYQQIESYTLLISGPAMAKHNTTPYTFRCVEEAKPDAIFKYTDTLTSRSELSDLAAKFDRDIIAIIGLGGTGSYILDYLAKTRVREIRLFDLDDYHVHNAFRSPGRLLDEELGGKKATVYAGRYEAFRRGISGHIQMVTSMSKESLSGITFAFVCVDKGPSREEVFDLLDSLAVPFIDVGMGLNRRKDALCGMLRVNYFPFGRIQPSRAAHSIEFTNAPDDEYRASIQTAELNALNACLAVIKYKQVRGFYLESSPLTHLLFGIEDLKIVGEAQDADED